MNKRIDQREETRAELKTACLKLHDVRKKGNGENVRNFGAVLKLYVHTHTHIMFWVT